MVRWTAPSDLGTNSWMPTVRWGHASEIQWLGTRRFVSCATLCSSNFKRGSRGERSILRFRRRQTAPARAFLTFDRDFELSGRGSSHKNQGQMVVELSSDSCSSSTSYPVEIPEDILEVLRIWAFYRTPLDFIEPLDPLRATRQVTTFDPTMKEALSTSNQGPGPFANSPKEVRGQKRPMRPCPFLGQYFNDTPMAYAEFKRVFNIPPNVEVWLQPNRDPRTILFGRGS
ncbi:hypothetical protein RHMOL_Rhmol13G0175800 [Rhododendron molle]|uniref:Uncharacterized protein n=1 Tax=Rhododendron molle TaxID=49168 RepID=A0ACC0L834_RHOML|nr:hypothetical protein RHMOL_Rhmol13G0175800 [Rhododendron molle]